MTESKMHIDRWNGNTLRRYHLAHAVAVVHREPGKPRRCAVIPRCMVGVAVEVSAAATAAALRSARKGGRADA